MPPDAAGRPMPLAARCRWPPDAAGRPMPLAARCHNPQPTTHNQEDTMIMMQKTFGMFEGLDESMPIAPHPADEFICEDTGEWKRRDEVLFSYDGKAWWDGDEREEYEGAALVVLAETLLEGMDNYVDHDDSIEGVKHAAFNNDSTWREYVGDYYHDDCEGNDDFTDHELEMICDDLRDRAETAVMYSGYSSLDYDLLCWDVGEVTEQISINDHPLLKALHGRGDLDDMLEDCDCDHEFLSSGRLGKFVSGGSYPSLDLMLASDKTYWWGCSHETMEEVYQEHVGCQPNTGN
jgi:hypothetical protein